jgi:short-subunit dehydrogenase
MTSKKQVFKSLLYLIFIIALYQICIFLFSSAKFFHRHFILKGKDLSNMYGKNSWVIITGASSGQGKYFAHEMAKRDFNLILIGSERTHSTIEEISRINPNTEIKFIQKDFRQAYEANFFKEIESVIDLSEVKGNVSGLINNVAYRIAWNPYHETPEHHINDSIVVGTIVQSQLTRIAIDKFLKRDGVNKSKSNFIVNITAQCIFPTFGIGQIMDNNITVPYLSVYEGANAFGFYQGNSIYKEYNMAKYKNKIHILNVMPGAVVTENTEYLGNTMFNVSAEQFVKNVVKQIGTYQGNAYGYWGHEFSILLVNIFPFIKDKTLYNVGLNISKDFMTKPNKKY